MLLDDCPEALKHILPYLQRASELKAREPVIAYYCGYYALTSALSKGYPKSTENDGFIGSIFDDLEKEKKELSNEPAMHDPEQARALILHFAMKIFLAADNEDRTGKATKKTGRLFLVASQFLEVMKGIGEVPEEIEERIKYAKWKATDIVRALNEGRQPIAGPPSSGEQSMDQLEIAGPSLVNSPPQINNNLPSLSGQFSPGSPPSSMQQTTPPIILPSIKVPGPVTVASSSVPTITNDPMAFANAEKYARFAISAIQFEDIPTALKNLELSMNILLSLQNK